ncbi:MAG TPA: hypothetical protein VI895_13360 [Bdellovibrionota bacterium]|nr:hypothetical protein [Bdellovibrionota bacterium]
MKKLLLATLPLIALTAVGCSSSGPEGGSISASNGILVGFVVDAKSGEKLNFFGTTNNADDNNSTDQIYALVDGSFKTAQPCGTGDSNTTNTVSMNGCYLFRGLPTGVFFPVFVQRSGYEGFSGTVFIDPDAATDFYGAAFGNEPQFAGSPGLYANIRIFPTGISYDYTVLAELSGRGIPDVSVRCVFNGSNDFDVVGDPGVSNYIDPDNDFNPIVSGTTDASGVVVFAGSTLTKGASYDCAAHATDEVDGAVVSYTGFGGFTVGVDDNFVTISLSASGTGLFAIYSNIDDGNHRIGENGPVTIVLNRDASLVGGANCVAAEVSTPSFDIAADPNATTNPNVDNTASEQATVDVTGDTVTLTPTYLVAPSGGDLGYTWTFGGVFLTPASGEDAGAIYSINGGYAGISVANDPGANVVSGYGDCDGVETAASGALNNVNTGAPNQVFTATLN